MKATAGRADMALCQWSRAAADPAHRYDWLWRPAKSLPSLSWTKRGLSHRASSEDLNCNCLKTVQESKVLPRRKRRLEKPANIRFVSSLALPRAPV
ncbi:unnamed protein product [Caenorhabditis auriculariae]|uniref:Uncharacterized protein n=1 Tax=Caenorhabditis auriculariae TaxID=2777116 RepID=A0A8S1HG31_9PELO|nr:unnamed protein product [Caenorhabditis auriculariae]